MLGEVEDILVLFVKLDEVVEGKLLVLLFFDRGALREREALLHTGQCHLLRGI